MYEKLQTVLTCNIYVTVYKHGDAEKLGDFI
jgi:hypothetical protein